VPAVRGDAQQLEQVVLNLLLNAEQALAKGSDDPRITIGLSAAGGIVRLVVADTGPGISPENLPRIFEPFFTTKPIGQGTGLGLSICYRIVEAHAGRIWAESGPGGGATLIMELPADATATHAGETPAAPPLEQHMRWRVLVIDDEPDVAETLRAVFDSLGQDVTVALGGQRGWERLSAPDATYELVTLDLKMPDLSGPKVWERLVSSNSALAGRVVFITGDTVDAATEGFLRRAGRPVLRKPFELRDIAGLIPLRVGAS
jgi:CheY-like chemotaxis protein